MSYQITLKPSGHVFAAAADQPLLASADAAGLTVPYGCRNGACSVCKATLLEGRVDHGASQEWALPAEQKAAGKVLLCCAKPLSDLVLEVREVHAGRDIPVKTLPCRVQKMERLAGDVMALHLKLPANERLQFLAGQYVEFILKDGSRRAFSLANAPHDDALLQVHIRRVPGGSFTAHVFDAMQEKDLLRFEGPLGSFYLREDSAKPIVMLAGGTGFAPIKALVEHMLHNRIERRVHLYWGARDRSWGVRSIGLEREPRGIQQAHKMNEQRPPLWIWSPMQFAGRTVHFSLSEYASGAREVDTVRAIPAFGRGGDLHLLRGATHDLVLEHETREMLAGSKVGFIDTDGSRRTITLHPLRRAYLRAGTGYGGPDEWRHGKYMGNDWADSVAFDLADPAVTARIGPTHVLCRMEADNGEVGFGTFETQVFGAFPRYGFGE
mgnify:CR=1 FL=1